MKYISDKSRTKKRVPQVAVLIYLSLDEMLISYFSVYVHAIKFCIHNKILRKHITTIFATHIVISSFCISLPWDKAAISCF